VQRIEMPVTWHEHEFPGMGTTVRVVVHGGAHELVAWAEREVLRLEARWSRFRADSDVARVNAAAGLAPCPVAPETIDLLARALELWDLTDGRFDPTILRALEACGYDESFEWVRAREPDGARRELVTAPPGRDPIRVVVTPPRAPSERAPGCAGIDVDVVAGTVWLPDGVAIDLGGVGKGYAGDLVARGLLARGALGACIGLGGDIRCCGAGPVDGDWDIEVEHPFDGNRALFTSRLRDAAIVTSTRLFRRWVHRGRWQHHLIDPATGAPADRGVAAVIVTDRDAWRAEGMAKAALVAGADRGRALLDHHGVAGWFVDDDQRVTESAAASRAAVRSAA
jgi:FAD:protein FMN transferase